MFDDSAAVTESSAMTEDQLIKCLRQRVVDKYPELLSKFNRLLDQLNVSKEKISILKRLVEIKDKDFFENLEQKSLEELVYICDNIIK